MPKTKVKIFGKFYFFEGNSVEEIEDYANKLNGIIEKSKTLFDKNFDVHKMLVVVGMNLVEEFSRERIKRKKLEEEIEEMKKLLNDSGF